MKTSLLLAVAAPLALSGCLEAVVVDVARNAGGTELIEIGSDRFRASWVQGDVGDVRGLWDDAPTVRGWTTDDYAWIDLRADKQAGGGAALLAFTIAGALGNPALVPGARLDLVGHCPQRESPVSVRGSSGRLDEDMALGEELNGSVQVLDGAEAGAILLLVDGQFDEDRHVTAAVEVAVDR